MSSISPRLLSAGSHEPLSPCACTQPSTSGTGAGGASPMVDRRLRERRRPRRAGGRRCSAARARLAGLRPRRPACVEQHDAGGRVDRVVDLRSRPAPSSIAARPTSSASSRATIAGRRRGHACRRARPAAAGRDRRRRAASPPCRAIIARNFAQRGADASASRTLRSASSSRRGAAAEPHHARRQPHDEASRSAGPAALQRLDALGDLEGVADGAARAARPCGDERFGPDAVRRRRSPPATAPAPARRRAVFMNAPRAALDVEHQRVAALGDLLAHHRRGDQRDALDRRRDVAQRVQLLVGGRDVVGLADQAAADLARAPLGTRRATARRESPGIASSLSSVPPVWPRPRPDIFGTTTPQAAASGARTIDTLSPTPPVLCLPTLMPGMRREVDAVARARPSRRSARRSPRRSCRAGRSPSAARRPGSRATTPSVDAARRTRRSPRATSASPSRLARMMSTARMGSARQYTVDVRATLAAAPQPQATDSATIAANPARRIVAAAIDGARCRRLPPTR